MLDALEGLGWSIVHRPYAFLPFAAFLILAARRFSWPRALLMAAAGWAIAFASEASSIRNGFPYGAYSYLDEALERDWRIAGVPFFDSLSYTFLVYFSSCVARLMIGKPDRASSQQTIKKAATSPLLTAVLVALLDLVVDPTAVRGERWFLGRIFMYEHSEGWFGVPWSNAFGWFVTGFLIAVAFDFIGRGSIRADSEQSRAAPNELLLGAVGYFGIALFSIVIAFWIGEPVLGMSSLVLMTVVLGALALRQKENLK